MIRQKFRLEVASIAACVVMGNGSGVVNPVPSQWSLPGPGVWKHSRLTLGDVMMAIWSPCLLCKEVLFLFNTC